MLFVIDYGTGNISSIISMLKKVGFRDVDITNQIDKIHIATKLILPGVGHFDYGMAQLKKSGLIEALNQRVLHDKIPILGICLGAQLLTKGSEEGNEPGLGWINAQTVRFDENRLDTKLKVPHMGWSDVTLKKQSRLFDQMPDPSRFYFVHKYHMVCAEPQDELLTSTHGYAFTAAVEHDNIMGVQFHPEKSHKFGMQLLSNFVHNY
jgi:glutamine amidotransferase